jgi:hypothetical protein
MGYFSKSMLIGTGGARLLREQRGIRRDPAGASAPRRLTARPAVSGEHPGVPINRYISTYFLQSRLFQWPRSAPVGSHAFHYKQHTVNNQQRTLT